MTAPIIINEDDIYIHGDQPPLYWPFNQLAALVGIAPETLLREIEIGRAQIRVARFGTRGQGDRYAHRLDALAYLDTLKQGVAA